MEKSFLCNEGGCRDQCHFIKKKGTRRCLHQYTKSLITPSLYTSLTCCLFVINARGKAQHLGIQLPACCDLEETKMYGWGYE